jgi:SRSO17 transposase
MRRGGHTRPNLSRRLNKLTTPLGAFQVRFRRPEGRKQRLQEFLTHLPWDEAARNRQRVRKMIVEATRGEGILGFDATGFPKQGTASVGVERQYSGTLGKVGPCQIAVICCDPERQATWPVAGRLDVPKTWAQDPARRQQTRVPAAIPLQTKPEMALTLLDQARAWGVPHRCVVADADDGDHPNFLAGLEARQAPYVVAVRTDFQISRGQAATSPVWRVAQLLQTVPRWQWRTMRWRHGTQGWLRKKFVGIRGWRVTSDGHRHEGWWVGERAPRGQPEERKYVWSHLPPHTPLEELAGLAHRRHAIEPFHEAAKGALGWDQYPGRLWPGFHRHAVTVRLAYSVLVWLAQRQRRRHQREGRRRDPCSPSADTPAPDPSGGAS